jgi:hypothetical protein
VARQVVVAQVAFLLKLLALCVESVTARVYAEVRVYRGRAHRRGASRGGRDGRNRQGAAQGSG